MEEKIRKLVSKASHDFGLIKSGDRILVAVSGGKDSTLLLWVLSQLRRRAAMDFTIHGVMLDQGQPGFYAETYLDWIKEAELPLKVIREDTFGIVKSKTEPGKSYCGLCSRLRRGILTTYAQQNGFNKIALGHHRDDVNETLVMNMFYSGKIASMPALYKEKRESIEIIRPLIYVAEEQIKQWSADVSLPVIPCNLCGNQQNLVRQKVKKLLQEFEADHKSIGYSLFNSVSNIKWNHLPVKNCN